VTSRSAQLAEQNHVLTRVSIASQTKTGHRGILSLFVDDAVIRRTGQYVIMFKQPQQTLVLRTTKV